MVALGPIQSSNERISSLGAGLVAVFVGATNGVGETTVKQFAKYALKPRVYIVGRSQEAADRIIAHCQSINQEGTFTFVKSDSSQLRNIDKTCEEIARAETSINILCLTVGTLQLDTEEGLHYPMALTIHGRYRFISNLLPLVRRARGLRRVVTVFGATFEGSIDMTDFQGLEKGWPRLQAHMASITTLSLEAFHRAAPEVSFIHNFPGSVESGIARGSIGPLMRTLKTIFGVLGSLVHIPLEEAGDRHLFLCTSARFPAGSDDDAAGIELANDLAVARGISSSPGTGVYSIDAKGESAGAKVERLLTQYQDGGMIEDVTKQLDADIKNALAAKAREYLA